MTTLAVEAPHGVSSGTFLHPDLIGWQTQPPEERTFSREFAHVLAQSIRNDGLLQPIVVRLDPVHPGRYLGVIGYHRWFAIREVLRWSRIEAKVIEATDASAAIKRVAENLFRNPLSKAQQAHAVKLWHARFTAEAARVQSGPGGQGDSGPSIPPTPSNFAAHVSEQTRVSKTTVKRLRVIGEAFEEWQLELLEQRGVSQAWLETIAKVKVPEKRDRIVALIAGGSSPESAVSVVSGSGEVKRADGRIFRVGDTDPGLSDEAWVERHCGAIMRALPNPVAFKADAILWRATSEARAALKAKTRSARESAGESGSQEGLLRLLGLVCDPGHPRDWTRCESCDGHGIRAGAGGEDPCPSCLGGGYRVVGG